MIILYIIVAIFIFIPVLTFITLKEIDKQEEIKETKPLIKADYEVHKTINQRVNSRYSCKRKNYSSKKS